MMRALRRRIPEIDFARPQPDFQRRRPWMGWLLLVGALLLAGSLLARHRSLLEQHESLSRQLGAATARDETASDPRLETELRFAGDVLALGRVPWEALFQAVEAAAAPNVVLLSVHPQGSGREMRIRGEASDFAALSAYLARIEAAPGIVGARLLGHQPRDGRADGGSALRFELMAFWRNP